MKTGGQRQDGSLSYVALGSNTGDSLAALNGILPRLQQLSVAPLLKSSLWQSMPVDCPPGSPLFLNGVVALVPKPDETSESLLSKLQSLEREFGRRPKKVLNEPRPLDLDIVAFGNEVCSTPSLTLPHPRAHLRRFVLQPLAEIAPDLVLPGQTKTVSELLAGLTSDEAVRKFGNLGEK